MSDRREEGRFGLSHAQRLDWLQLCRSENIGPRTFHSLIKRFGGAGGALAALPKFADQKVGGRPFRIAARDDCERELAALDRLGGRFIAVGEADYPAALGEIDGPPPLIAVRGDVRALARPMVAIVGSRNASAAGISFTDKLVRGLAEAGFVIASGLARGIDQSAHRASLQSGTIAVLAGGLDKIYPAEHIALANDICARGALLSEMPIGWEPRGRDFPRRNRLVSGLALGTVVIEAARRSGSLITARFANEQGREVFAVPGSPLDPRAEGANDLLRQGATLCTSSEDVIEALAPLVASGVTRRGGLFDEPVAGDDRLWDERDLDDQAVPRTHSPHQHEKMATPSPAPRRDMASGATTNLVERVQELLGPSPVTIDDLVRATGHSAAEIQAAIMELDILGQIGRHGGNRVSLLQS
ncbi:DNA-processing protein DprA [Roseiarcaceae bacterium H3SJ34-1]|uniref:DNA-processing protein DprA n=1 Tax=Terripilifer ovatus TaxID=3032367 RepID=UPI003AB91E02|nr:DNA-processing protein DprA [Roseiarcaceae bacterium H3SJ34-1]